MTVRGGREGRRAAVPSHRESIYPARCTSTSHGAYHSQACGPLHTGDMLSHVLWALPALTAGACVQPRTSPALRCVSAAAAPPSAGASRSCGLAAHLWASPGCPGWEREQERSMGHAGKGNSLPRGLSLTPHSNMHSFLTYFSSLSSPGPSHPFSISFLWASVPL